jgi:ribosomal protein L7/L12
MEPIYWLFALLAILQLISLIVTMQNQTTRLERKIDAILRELGIQVQGGKPGELSDRVKELASDPGRKIEAIKVHREESGAGLKDAKDAVESWMASHER